MSSYLFCVFVKITKWLNLALIINYAVFSVTSYNISSNHNRKRRFLEPIWTQRKCIQPVTKRGKTCARKSWWILIGWGTGARIAELCELKRLQNHSWQYIENHFRTEGNQIHKTRGSIGLMFSLIFVYFTTSFICNILHAFLTCFLEGMKQFV